MASGNFLRTLRIGLMVYLLLFVAAGAWFARARSTSWDQTLWVAIYPINGDNSGAVSDYIDDLELRSFKEVRATCQPLSEEILLAIPGASMLHMPIALTGPPSCIPAMRRALSSVANCFTSWRASVTSPGSAVIEEDRSRRQTVR